MRRTGLSALNRASALRKCKANYAQLPAAARMFATMPAERPESPNFGSGPCKKRPGYDLAKLQTNDVLGRSHRSKLGLKVLQDMTQVSREMLKVPDDYHLAMVAGSDTGAYELAMWNLLGERPVDILHWESFGTGWKTDAVSHLKLDNVRDFGVEEYGQAPDFSAVDSANNDVLFTFNGTTSGVRVPNLDWIDANRKGLTLCDATSAVFAMDIEWSKIDVLTYSFQKALGGEGGHGILILSPRAVERLESFTPENRPLPKIFRLTKKGKFQKGIFEGKVINTPSMLAVCDALDAMNWAKSIGGLDAMIARSNKSLQILEDFAAENPWLEFLAQDKATRSNTSICFKINWPEGVDGAVAIKTYTSLLEQQKVAYDIGAYRDAPAGLRIWGGATVEPSDMQKLTPWLKWAYDSAVAEHSA